MSSHASSSQSSENSASDALPAAERGQRDGCDGFSIDAQNEAAESPRPVTRGESLENTEQDHAKDHSKTPHPYSAFTDWLTVTFPFTPSRTAIAQFKNELCDVIGLALGGLKERKGGIDGFEASYAFDHFGALFAYGGKSQAGRAMLKLTGEACATIPDWHGLALYLERTLGARITRWDGAVDCIEGQHTVDEAVGWFKDGGFNAGGNQPKHQCLGPWLLPSYEGRTLYIGDRKNGKLMRIYEKGKQLDSSGMGMHQKWVRFELELHNKDRVIPLDVLTRPGHYLAGAYPCMAWANEEAFRIRTIQAQGQVEYSKAIANAKQSYGQLVNVMGHTESSPESVLKLIRRGGIPKRLILPSVPYGEGLRT